VLTTLLESTFIEHLKLRLDYKTYTFKRINDQLERHPTRHGDVVRVLCDADPADPDASGVVAALTRGYQELTAERRDMVRSFLVRQIDEARSDASAEGVADWKEQLSVALDYRRWLKISLQYRPGKGGKWTVFDTAKHAAKSVVRRWSCCRNRCSLRRSPRTTRPDPTRRAGCGWTRR
jgi:hypothetical protein